ncbi:MAG: acyl-phosphate glycerol 3-phosphate acyltransferase [Bacteroidetes bacterium 24-39-8]|jgi:acyl phosphate:glycerol-3-phosphate acyltransferase|nr:MAG: acyl-phosphate glycerol 3-phosphate acyltransferase [Sphingobacteriia bacterium 35-40-8]OYZ51458.1 MAG: acyl-phosphate glycerol 3-phosphate acyltransferase [Bacteroidetes bacterium 24-39-8]OZA68315.1 MAG: acyl-phosphate glycerol 3-phosphate acyltransferase [Sphingobacteriia bacterium 39-39-8]HQR91817.1 glycerol-3-phosphate 1-O-acyltransferase PlsY [Sediminibacterium sp.]HQS54880.1 glycerol-3-phosphate 1-O-acyltransferase PlsY [Sediminibacterium sp.]
MNEFLLIVLAYLIGSIPTAVWVSKAFFNIDIREYGSGNAGATNTFRVLGSKWGSFVMLVDVLKGVLATSLYILLPYYLFNEWDRTNFMIGLGLASVLGHIFPIWANFRGGKGVATLLGMAVAIQPLVALCCVGVFLIVLYLTRFVSLSSILAGVSFMIFILFIFNEKETLYRVFAVLVALMVVLTHQKNIGRILKGTESKVPILKHRDRRKQRRKEGI